MKFSVFWNCENAHQRQIFYLAYIQIGSLIDTFPLLRILKTRAQKIIMIITKKKKRHLYFGKKFSIIHKIQFKKKSGMGEEWFHSKKPDLAFHL